MDKAFICLEISEAIHISNLYSHCQFVFQMMCQFFPPENLTIYGDISLTNLICKVKKMKITVTSYLHSALIEYHVLDSGGQW